MHKDVVRTFQDKELFLKKETKNILTNILLTWGLNNRKIGYRQGMNDIAGILFECHFLNLEEIKSKGFEKNENEKFFEINNEKFLEEDVFIMFDALMKSGIQDFYEHEENGKKKKSSSTRMFGRVDYGNVSEEKSLFKF